MGRWDHGPVGKAVPARWGCQAQGGSAASSRQKLPCSAVGLQLRYSEGVKRERGATLKTKQTRGELEATRLGGGTKSP